MCLLALRHTRCVCVSVRRGYHVGGFSLFIGDGYGRIDRQMCKHSQHLVPCSHAQDLLAILAEHATSADDINTILDRIHKNHR